MFGNTRLDKIERRVEALEKRAAAFQYRGVWDEGPYQEGNFVTHQGSLWHCNRATSDRPGRSDAWTLAVKRGARDRGDRS